MTLGNERQTQFLGEDELDLFAIWSILRANLRLILLLFFFAVLSAGVVTYFFIPRKYKSTITFYLQPKGSSSALSALGGQLGGLSNLIGDLGGLGTPAELCSEIVTSRQLIAKVLAEEGLPNGAEDIRRFQKAVHVENKKSGAITVSVLWTDPQMAYRLVNRLFAHYKQFMEENIQSSETANRQFIEEQYEKAKTRLAAAEEALLAYQKKYGLVVLPDQAVKAMEYFAEIEKQRAETEVALHEARQRLKEAETLLAQEEPMIKSALTESINPVLQEYRSSLSRIELELAKARENYTDQHPQVKSLLAQRAELMAKMEREKERILTSETMTANPVHQTLASRFLEGQIELTGLESRSAALDGLYKEYRRQLEELPEELYTYGRLLREEKVAEQIYLMLCAKLEEARLAEAKEEKVKIQVIDPAWVPDKKYSPSTALNMAVAGILALFVGVGWAFIREYWSATRTGFKPSRASKA